MIMESKSGLTQEQFEKAQRDLERAFEVGTFCMQKGWTVKESVPVLAMAIITLLISKSQSKEHLMGGVKIYHSLFDNALKLVLQLGDPPRWKGEP